MHLCPYYGVSLVSSRHREHRRLSSERRLSVKSLVSCNSHQEASPSLQARIDAASLQLGTETKCQFQVYTSLCRAPPLGVSPVTSYSGVKEIHFPLQSSAQVGEHQWSASQPGSFYLKFENRSQRIWKIFLSESAELGSPVQDPHQSVDECSSLSTCHRRIHKETRGETRAESPETSYTEV